MRNLMASVQPGVLYGVYLNLPGNASEAQRDSFRVGYINFFDAADHGGGAQSLPPKFFSFDVTKVVRSQADSGLAPDTPSVTIIPHGTPDNSAGAIVGDISLHEG